MKIWKSFSGEHSAKLRIIGTFKTDNDAKKAADCFNDIRAVKDKGRGNNLYFSDELSTVLRKHNFHLFTENDPEQLDFLRELDTDKNQIVVDTDEVEIQALIKILISYSANIQIYSKHDYSVRPKI